MKNILLIFSFIFLRTACFSQWTVINFNTATDVSRIKFYGANEVWLACDTGVFRSTNNGGTFSQNGLYFPNNSIYLASYLNDVAVINSTTAVGAGLFYLGNEEMIIRTTNSAVNWDTVEFYHGTFLAQFHSVDFPTTSIGYIAGWQGRIFRSVNGGVSWSGVYTNPSISLYDIAMTSANVGAAAGETGIFYTANGITWNQVLNITNSVFNVVSFKGSNGYAGGYSTNGNFYKTVNNGSSWTAANFPYAEIKGLQTISVDTIVAVTLTTAYKTCNGGLYWEEFVLPPMPPGSHILKDIEFRGSEGYIACSDGVLFKTTNGGGVTKPIASFTTPPGSYCESMNYTFTNTSPAVYTYQWKIDGTLVSTNYNLNISLADSGTHTVSLIAFNGNYYDTISTDIFVNAQNFIAPLSYNVDTICPGHPGSISVFNSKSGLTYRLRNGFINIGSPQFGNNGTLTFSISPQQTTNYNILTTGSNACYTDSIITNITQVVFPDKYLPVIAGDTLICSGRENYHVDIQNTQPGVLYKLIHTNTVDSAFGNGGTITLSTPVIYGFGINMSYYVNAYLSSSCNVILRNITLHVDTNYAKFNVANANTYPGDSISFQDYSSADNYEWTFPPQANIQTSTSQNPKIVINTPGVYNIKLKTTTVEGCVDSVTAKVYIMNPAPTGIANYCGNTPLSPSSLTPYDSYLDKNKNLYLTGSFTGPGFQGPQDWRYFVLKVDSNGNLLWYRTANPYSTEKASGQGIAVDDFGNVYVAGFFKGMKLFFNTFEFNGGNITNQKGFLIKYDSNGNEKWIVKGVKQSNADFGMWFSDVAIDSANRIYFTGEHENGVFTFPDSSTFTATGDSTTAFLMSVDSSGSNYSYTTFGAISGGRTTGASVSFTTNPRLDILSNHDFLITSCYSDSSNNMHTQFGTFNFTDTSNVIYAAIYSPVTGFKKVIRGPGGKINYMRKAIADSDKNIYLIGSVQQNLEFKNSFYNLDGTYSIGNTTFPAHSFVAKLDSGGSSGWINYSRFSNITDIAVNSNKDLMFSAFIDSNGFFANQNFIPQSISTYGKADAVVGKYNSNGNILFANKLGTIKHDVAFSINLDSCDNMKVSTSFNRTQISAWPDPSFNYADGNFDVQYLSKDSFCTHDAGCNDILVDTLHDDAALLSVSLSKTLTGYANIPIWVRLKSFGTDTLRYAQIFVEVNGVQQSGHSWNGLLAKYHSIDSLSIGNLNFIVPGIKIIKAYVKLPNNNTDFNNLNDTVYTTLDVCAPLAGTYTIGAGGNFSSFSDAVTHLKECGINGHVYFDVLPGVYTDRIYLNNIPSSINDSIVFRSANHDSTSVVLQWGSGYPYRNALVELNKTNYVTFYQMTIRNLDLDNAVNMNILTDTGCTNLNIWNCVIDRLNPDTVIDGSLFRQDNSESDFLNIQHNLFFQGGSAVTLWGVNQNNTVVKFNRLINQTSYGINMQDIVNPKVTDNYIESNFHKHNAFFGIGISWIYGGFTISRNKIVVYNGDAHGIAVGGNFTATNPGLVSNNMVSIFNSDETSIGLQLNYSCKYINIYNNSFYISGTSTKSAGIYGGDQDTNINIKNNIFLMGDNGYVMWYYNFNSASINLDYNCYFTNGTVFTRLDSQSGTTNLSSFNQWQSYSGLDVHSKFHAANFISQLDLHIINDVDVENAATPIASVTDDFDFEIRSLVTPDMGCDEFFGTLSANNQIISEDFIIFPNPVADDLFIQLNSTMRNSSIRIYDVTGRIVLIQNINSIQNQIHLSTSKFTQGNYFVEILSDDFILRSRFVKK